MGKIKDIILLIMLGLIFFGMAVIINSIFSISILSFLGFSYESFKDIFLFLVIYSILSSSDIMISRFIENIKKFKNLNNSEILILDMILSICSNIIMLLLSDLLVRGVKISFISIIIFSFISFIICKKINKEIKKIDERYKEAILKQQENTKKEMEDAIINIEEELSNSYKDISKQKKINTTSTSKKDDES